MRNVRKHLLTGMGSLLLTVCLNAQDMELPAPNREGGMPLMQALAKRQSSRLFSPRELPTQILSDLLWAAFGVNRPDGKRTAPSSNNTQAIDIYVCLPNGVFLYDARRHALKAYLANDIRKATGRQSFTQIAPVNLVYVANLDRLRGRDEQRTFYSATDTGFISQNVYLYCAATGLNTVVLGYVEREQLHQALKLSDKQTVVLTQPVGFPP